MRCFQDQMLRISVQHGFFHLSRSAPQQKYHWTILLIQDADCCIGKFFPIQSPCGNLPDVHARSEPCSAAIRPVSPISSDTHYPGYNSHSHRAVLYKYLQETAVSLHLVSPKNKVHVPVHPHGKDPALKLQL